ncbi:MAG: aminotransferase class I/II-fold pyridoxal phosphate-dependent enzyme [Pseudomonadota bacterium]
MKRYDPVAAMANIRREFGEHGGVNMSVEASTTFTVMDAATMPELFKGRLGPDAGGCYLYGRHFNPTVYVLGRQLAAMEGAEAAYCTASGMGAISAVVMQLCGPGDHAVVSHTLYGGSYALFHDYLPAKAGVNSTLVDIGDLAAVERAFKPSTRLLYVETLSNPMLRMADLPALAKIARKHGVPLVVDNTFCPLSVQPMQHGADIVVHSLTKFVSGASDIIAGAICASAEFIGRLMDLHTGSLMLLGPTMDPHCAFNLSLRLPHLSLRMLEHSRRARFMAERLAARGDAVIYPGLPTHPDHAILKRLADPQYHGGGILGLDLKTAERANRLMQALQHEQHFGFIAVSLGYFDTLMSCSASSTSSEMTDSDMREAGISPGLVRISVGITGDLEQRWSQLETALKSL